MSDDPGNELTPQFTAPQKVPDRIDLGKLELIRRWSQYAAVVVFVIFAVLFVAGTIQLSGINAKIAKGKDQLEQQEKRIKDNEQKIREQEEQLKVKDSELKQKDKNLVNAINELGNTDQQIGPQQAGQLQQKIESLAGNIAARIYIQIGDAGQKQRATEAARTLRKQGYIVPGIENVGGRANIPRVSELRFYQNDSVAQEDKKDIISTLSGLGINLKENGPLNRGGVRPRHYEIWFGQEF